ncbi:MAG: hypothetical protein LBH70_05935 [Spirochaetaceae bacterium]|jgi:hypothetical protein|nr:hypothetical protein [Spirochaetaceae bacterium]
MIAQKFKTIPFPVKRIGIFAGWTVGLMVVSAVLWGFMQPVRNTMLLNSVNRVLAERGEEIRLETPLSSWGMPGRAVQSGTWFTTADSPEWAVVFTVAFDGVFTPFLTVVSQDGKAGSLIPLSLHGEAVFQRIPQGQLRIYIRRIEASHAVLRRARED